MKREGIKGNGGGENKMKRNGKSYRVGWGDSDRFSTVGNFYHRKEQKSENQYECVAGSTRVKYIKKV